MPATIATAQTAPEASEQKTDDSDLFALPKRSLEDEIASASKEAAEVRKRVEAAEERADAAEEAADILERLANSKSNDSDLFALPTDKPSLAEAMATVDEELKAWPKSILSVVGRVWCVVMGNAGCDGVAINLASDGVAKTNKAIKFKQKAHATLRTSKPAFSQSPRKFAASSGFNSSPN